MQVAQKDFYKKLLGRVGERKAVKFLKNKGFKILKTNYKSPFGEIDIIAQEKDTIVFVEVKARSGVEYGRPSEAVDKRKQQRYYKIATYYLQREKKMDSQCRFDVIEIENSQINHIFNAFCM